MSKFAVLASVLLACGGKTDEPPKPESRPAETRPADPGSAESKPTPAPVPAVDPGSCKVTISGAATAQIDSKGATSKAVASYWFADGDRANLLFPNGKVGLIVNCTDANGSISILSGPKVTKDSLPLGPKKYTIDKKLAGGELHVLGTVGKTALMGPVGTFEITAFDTRHVAGTFQFTATTLPGKGEAKIEGTFDYTCASFSGCAK